MQLIGGRDGKLQLSCLVALCLFCSVDVGLVFSRLLISFMAHFRRIVSERVKSAQFSVLCFLYLDSVSLLLWTMERSMSSSLFSLAFFFLPQNQN